MDSRLVGSDALRGHESVSLSMISALDSGTKEQGRGSGLPERSGLVEDDRRKSKMACTDDDGDSEEGDDADDGVVVGEATRSPTFISDSPLYDEQKLRFSTIEAGPSIPRNDGSSTSYQNSSFPCYHPSISYPSNAGPGGPFTASQRMELEHQMLILKQLIYNVPLSESLILYIRTNYIPSGFSGLLAEPSSPGSSRSFPVLPYYSDESDEDLERCHRTDGKKWRCWRNAMANKKYCQRHSKKSGHNSRKPLRQRRTGVPACWVTEVSSTSAPDSFFSAESQIASAADFSSMHINRIAGATSNPRNSTHFSMTILMSSSVNLQADDGVLRPENPMIGSSYGSHLNKQRSNCIVAGNVHSSADQDSEDSQSELIRQLIDKWPRDQVDYSLDAIWPEEDQSKQNQLLVLEPITSSGFPSISSSSTQEQHSRLTLNELTQREENWEYGYAEASLWGPLGEALKGFYRYS